MTTEDTPTATAPETFAEYKAARLAPPKVEPPPVVAPAAGNEPPDPTEGTPEDAPIGAPPKPKRGLEQRFSELTTRAKAAEARAAEAEARAAEIEARLAPKQAAPADTEPAAASYTDAAEYARDLAKWSVAKALKERDAAQAAEAVQKSWAARLTAARAEIPDFDTALEEAGDVSISDVLRDAVVESDVGPRILHHFAVHPEEAQKMNQMTPAAALRAFGKLEARFEQQSPAGAATKAAPAAKTLPVRAPEPVSPIRAAAGSDALVNAKGEFEGTFAQYKALRAKGKI